MVEINRDLDTTPLPEPTYTKEEGFAIAGWIRTKRYGKHVREAIARFVEWLSLRTEEIETYATGVVQTSKDIQSRFENLVIGNTQFKNEIISEKNAVIANATVDSEVILARGGKATLGQRLDETTAQLAQIATNVKTFGAIGDGVSHPLSERFNYLSQAKEVYPHAYSLNNELDWCAIQAAVNHVIEQGGGLVYLPAGRYVTSDKIELGNNVELAGSGMYNTTFYPNYLGENVFKDLIRANGTEENRMRDIVVRDFGIDGSNLEFYVKNEGEPAFEAGQWARIVPRFVDNFVAHDIFCYHGSHVFQMSGCENFIIDRIRTDYNFNVVHMTGGQNKRGVISNINASRVATVVDFGGGNSDVVVSDIYGNNEGYIRNDQEAFDIGGAKNVQISNALVENFRVGATVKGEGAEWDDVRFSNCTFIDFLQYGIRATSGDTTRSGKLSLSDCTFISDKMTLENGYAVEAIAGHGSSNGNFELSNIKIDVNKGGVNSYGFKSFDMKNVKIKAGSRGVFFQGQENMANESWDLVGLSVESAGAPIDLRKGTGKAILSDFTVVGGAPSDAAVFIRGVSNPILRNGLINNVGNHGVHLHFEPENVYQPNTVNGLLADLSNIVIRDWGQSAAYRQGVMFTVPSVEGDFKGLRFRDLTFEITGTQSSQIGISWSSFSTNNIDYSMMDGITFYRVPTPEIYSQYKGVNNVEKIINIG